MVSEKSKLFLVKPGEKPQPMTPSAPVNEDEMQKLIADYPELIAGGDGTLLLIEREHGIADSEGGYARWSVDLLFVTRDAIPVLVEVKRAVDTRLRREVVGQMLDYAANGVAYWPKGVIAARFEEHCRKLKREPEEVLSDFLMGESTTEGFWLRVDDNFAQGKVMLVFVADEIPRELACIVEFLNNQMKDADVRAIELRYFEGVDGVRTLAPRVIGETERGRVQKLGGRQLITQEVFFERLRDASPEAATALEQFFIKAKGVEVYPGLATKSIGIKWKSASGEVFNFGGINLDGNLVTYSVCWAPYNIDRIDLGHDYLDKLSHIVGGEVRKTPDEAQWYVVKNGTSLPNGMDILSKPDEWLNLIKKYQAAINEATETD